MKVSIVDTRNGTKRSDLEPLTIFSHDDKFGTMGEWLALPISRHCEKYLCLNLKDGFISVTSPDEICYPQGKIVFGV